MRRLRRARMRGRVPGGEEILEEVFHFVPFRSIRFQVTHLAAWLPGIRGIGGTRKARFATPK